MMQLFLISSILFACQFQIYVKGDCSENADPIENGILVRQSGILALYQCIENYTLVGPGPPVKICEAEKWIAKEPFRCIIDNVPKNSNTSWIRTKRRAIKPGGATGVLNKNKGIGGGSGGYGMRRKGKNRNRFGNKKGSFDIAATPCQNLDHDDDIVIQVIKSGDESNETFSEGAIVKVSCAPGFGVNVPNETVTCVRGNWSPKLPQCAALPCRVGYIPHGVFYEGSRPLYFHELKKTGTMVELRCLKGHHLQGPAKMRCTLGEWDVQETPECVPDKCKLREFDYGHYIGKEVGSRVLHGTEVDYTCFGGYQKLIPGPLHCEEGKWKPSDPFCLHPSVASLHRRNVSMTSENDVFCPPPPFKNTTYTFFHGFPLDWNAQLSFEEGSDVLYRCKNVKKSYKNRWKISCSKGKWVGNVYHECHPAGVPDKWMSLPDLNLLNSSCEFKRGDKHIVAFVNDKMVVEDSRFYPHGTEVYTTLGNVTLARMTSGYMTSGCRTFRHME